MGFSKMLGLLQIKSKGSIVLVNAGSFYVARGKDALLLNQLLNLKLNCLEMEVCKVGFPINSLDKYTKLIEEKLKIIPKEEKYIEYILQIILKLPRTEKFNIGNEYKISMYHMLRKTMYLNKIDKYEKKSLLNILNEIDAELNTQRIYLRIMQKSYFFLVFY